MTSIPTQEYNLNQPLPRSEIKLYGKEYFASSAFGKSVKSDMGGYDAMKSKDRDAGIRYGAVSNISVEP